jgi:hypothetical protein
VIGYKPSQSHTRVTSKLNRHPGPASILRLSLPIFQPSTWGRQKTSSGLVKRSNRTLRERISAISERAQPSFQRSAQPSIQRSKAHAQVGCRYWTSPVDSPVRQNSELTDLKRASWKGLVLTMPCLATRSGREIARLGSMAMTRFRQEEDGVLKDMDATEVPK